MLDFVDHSMSRLFNFFNCCKSYLLPFNDLYSTNRSISARKSTIYLAKTDTIANIYIFVVGLQLLSVVMYF